MEEFEKALDELKVNKAPGLYDISAELLKTGGEKLKTELYELICKIYETGELPEDFSKYIIVSIPEILNARPRYRLTELTIRILNAK